MESAVKVAIVQLKIVINSEKRNMRKALEYIENAAKSGADIVCLPEAFVTSMNLTSIEHMAEPIPGPISNTLCKVAKNFKIHIVAGILEKHFNSYYSAVVLIDDEGNIIGKYRRKYIYSLEKKYIETGEGKNDPCVFDTKLGKIGLICGYDIFYPDACRELYKNRVSIIICPALLPNEHMYITEKLVVARAIENNCCFIFVSGIGTNQFANITYMGNSMVVVDPNYLEYVQFDFIEGNEILVKSKSEECCIPASVNMQDIEEYWNTNTLYMDYIC